jgi:hypothetical protein
VLEGRPGRGRPRYIEIEIEIELSQRYLKSIHIMHDATGGRRARGQRSYWARRRGMAA